MSLTGSGGEGREEEALRRPGTLKKGALGDAHLGQGHSLGNVATGRGRDGGGTFLEA